MLRASGRSSTPAVFVFLSGQFLGGGGSAAAVAVGWADAKVDLSFDRALLLGMLCNELGLPCAVRRSHDHKRQDPRGAFSGVRVRGSELLALGSEHVLGREHVPDPLGLFIKTGGLATLLTGLSATIPDLGSLTWANITWSLVPVTLGTLPPSLSSSFLPFARYASKASEHSGIRP